MSTDRLPIAEQYIDGHDGNIRDAVVQFVADLERGDPASFKAGYSRENAILAASDAFAIAPEDIRSVLWFIDDDAAYDAAMKGEQDA